MKNKYIIWSSSAFIAVVLVIGSLWLYHRHTDRVDAQNLYESSTASTTASGQAGQVASQTGSEAEDAQTNAGTTIAAPTNQTTGQQISGSSTSTSTSVGGSSNSTNSIAKLLDPTSFSQYDKYKSATDASYIDLQVGTGATLASGQKAAVYYKGWLTNGTLFDQSQKGSDGTLQPFDLTLGAHQVITGWEEGLVGMKVGGVRLLIVPPAVGYGANGQASIPGNAVLIFQVQLAAVQ